MTRRFALIGHPVAGSLSPRLFAAAYGGRYGYDLLDFASFSEAWEAFERGYDGINVTAPFKLEAFARVNRLSAQARATGAVNLVVPEGDGYAGYNTDVDGVSATLRESGLSPADTLVVGTGGAARAAAYAASALGSRVTVTGRSLAKAAALGYDAIPLEEVPSCRPDLIIYTLPGSAPVPEGLPFRGAALLEAEYRAPRLADAPCACYLGGRSWLLHQAAAGYERFTSEAPDTEAMKRSLQTL